MKSEIFIDDEINKLTDEKLLLDIYHKMLYPPPIGKYSKELLFDSSLNMINLSPILYKNKQIILGDGSFSKVQLYEHKKTKIKYAVKKMNLTQLEKLSHNKKLINNEINIQGRINHPNIIRLYNFYKYNNNCFLVLEYASKSTLFDMIRKKSGLTESIAFYYFIQTLNAIYFLHLHSIIHRDLKPENLLINDNNILKLCDFGWSVKLNRNKRTTFCGTVEYMAPEIIKKQKYDESIDVWSLGVLLYELVHSYSPFCSEDLDIKKIGNNIIQNELKFKEGLSEEYKDLIKKILIKDCSKRIKIEEIYQHPFMTKYINAIYREINSNTNTLNIIKEKYYDKINSEKISNKNITNNLKIDSNNTSKYNKTIGEIVYRKNEKMKNKGCFYKKGKIITKSNISEIYDTKIKNKNKESQNIKKLENDLEIDKLKRDTNFIFASIPTEPEPKLLPDSQFYKEIKKVKTNFYLNEKQNISLYNKKNEPYHIISNTSRNKPNIIGVQKEQNIKTLFKNQNKISHVKSFSLGQNGGNFTQLKDNRFKIIISINNTQNRNYINKKQSKKLENLSSKNKKSLSNYLEENYLQGPSNLGIYNKNSPLQQTMNYNDKKNNSSKNNKIINQTYLFESKNILNCNNDYPLNYELNKKNKKNYFKNISYSKNNYIKTENNVNPNCQYISMINNSNNNTFSNIIINSNSPKSLIKGKKVFKLKKIIKNSNSSNDHSRFLRRINSDSYKKILINNNIKKNGSTSREIIEKIKNMKHNKNKSKISESSQPSKIDIHKISKSSIINKLIDKNIKKNLNKTINLNNPLKDKNYNIIKPNLTQNFDLNLKNRNSNNNYNLGELSSKNSKLNSYQNQSMKNKKIIKFSNSNKVIVNSMIKENKLSENHQKNEENKEKNIKKLFSALKLRHKKLKKLQLNNKSIKFELND